MIEYFYEMPGIERIIWITLPMLVNVFLYLFMKERTLRIFHKTNSRSLSLNSLRRMNTYLAVPLCILTTVLYFLMMYYFLLNFKHVAFIANFITMVSALVSLGFGLIILFIRNLWVAYIVTNVAPINNVNFYFNLNNLSTYIFLYVLMLLMVAGQGVIQLLKPANDLILLLYTLGYYILLIVVGRIIVARITKKQQQPVVMEDCELKNELLQMAATVKRKKVSIVIVDQDKSSFGAAAVYPVKQGTIFLSDTLLNTLTDEEVKAVMAHELAHLKYRHGGKRVFTFVLGIALASFFYEWLVIFKYWYEPETHYLLLTSFCFFYYGIFFKYLSRKQEYRADGFILKMGIPYEAFKMGMLKIINSYEVSFDYLPVEELFLTHPLLKKRVQRLAQLSDKLSHK